MRVSVLCVLIRMRKRSCLICIFNVSVSCARLSAATYSQRVCMMFLITFSSQYTYKIVIVQMGQYIRIARVNIDDASSCFSLGQHQ